MTWQQAGSTFERRDVVDLYRDGVGTVTHGIYEGRRLVHSKETNRDSMLYNIEIDGEKLSFWGTTVLDSRFEEIEPGKEVRIVYKGKVASATKGHNAMHSYDVFYRDPSDEEEDVPATDTEDEIPF